MKKDFLTKLNIPDKPGVYFFLSKKKIIYIGKATSLKSRTKSYFSKDLINTRGVITMDMVSKADNLKWVETDSVLEALILESNLIKKYQPYHNIREKDDKSFNYVCITKEELPKILVVRGKDLEKTKNKFSANFGPYTNGLQLREALRIIRPIFPFLDDKSKTGYEFYRQVGLVPDISEAGKIKIYKENIKNLKLFFQGKKKEIIKNLKKEMKALAKRQEFERADIIKKQIFALEHINDVALLKKDNLTISSPDFVTRVEAYDIAHMSGKNMVGVMTVVENGEPAKNEYKKFIIRTQSDANDTGALREVLERRFNHKEWRFPSLVVVDGGVAQLNAANSVLVKMDIKIPVVSVLKDERHKPKDILGDESSINKHKQSILLSNSEAHRFSIAYHKNMRGRNFLPELKRK